jgi:hypothetical protein
LIIQSDIAEPSKQLKTPEEMEAMILTDLRKMDGCLPTAPCNTNATRQIRICSPVLVTRPFIRGRTGEVGATMESFGGRASHE